MGEGDKLFDLGGMKSSVGPVRRGSNSREQVNLPKAIGGGIAAVSEDGLVSMGHSHVMLGLHCSLATLRSHTESATCIRGRITKRSRDIVNKIL